MGELTTTVQQLRASLTCRSSISSHPTTRWGLVFFAFVALLHSLFSSEVTAQSVTNFKTSDASPPAIQNKEISEKSTNPSVIAIPSRLVGPAELEPFVASLTSIFSMRTRETDPFGQLQDPNAKPIIKTPIAKSTQRAPVFQATPFSEIVRLILITTIMPKEKRFLVGNRSVSLGEKLPLSFRGRTIRVEIMDVSSERISFRNLESGEIAHRKMSMLPAGMTPGQKGITAPGMVPDNKNAPLELEIGDSSEDLSRSSN